MKALIYITPKDDILDPQGQTVGTALRNMGISHIDEVRIGKFVEMTLPKLNLKQAEKATTEACERLLVNPNIETYRFEIDEEA
ncbi:MAG: phosphoribosylformylglycinamidine synthase subunit PurS [Candidatus Marinimicrobia bacterium]|nr:phosphoribosylformylglycinamidine synthase subunit PurS [Candidatus Neomarinimicrobiota bacterium]